MNNSLSKIKYADKFIIIIVAILGIISIITLESTVYDNGFKLERVVLVQFIAYLIGFALMFALLKVDYTFFIGWEKFLYIGSIVFMLLVYLPGIGVEQFGSRAWINLGITTLQPSEFVKISFILLMASYLSNHREDIKKFRGVLMAGVYALPIIVIVLKEDLGSALVFMVIWLFMVFFAGIDYKVLIKSVVSVLIALPVVYLLLDNYQKERINAFLHPDNLSLSGNYQVWQSKVAIGSGGFFGKGLFNGTQKSLDFIPVQQSDFIFSVIVEELGFLGGLIVIALYTGLLYRFTKVILNAIDLYGALIAVGITAMFLFQVFENIAMTMGIMPVTGITLPLLSRGGTSVIASLIAISLMLNIGINSKHIRF